MAVVIRPEAEKDRAAIGEINQKAFGGDAEANLVAALRADGLAAISLVAELDGKLVGHILFSPVSIHTTAGSVAALALAPMAVLPHQQQQGIGTKLVQAALEACREAGHRIILVLGHPGFYGRFGFCATLARRLESPFGGGEAWMALELVPGSLAGVRGRVEYSPPFQSLV